MYFRKMLIAAYNVSINRDIMSINQYIAYLLTHRKHIVVITFTNKQLKLIAQLKKRDNIS